MATSWSQAEEKIIAELMERDSLGRLEAIQRLRRLWLIGTTRPPMWREGRAMPKANPNTVKPGGVCQHCGLPLPAHLRNDARYCDSTCQRNARFAKSGGRAVRMAA